LQAAELPQFWTAFDDVGLVHGATLKVLLLTEPKAGRGCPHAPRAHQRRMVDNAGKARP
jgi:hypothetical protein